jgi:hypothetical protein
MPIRPDCIRKPTNPTSRSFVPKQSRQYHVRDGDSWEQLALQSCVGEWQLLTFNFPTLPIDRRQAALEVNWYLQEYVGCKLLTADHKNYRFGKSASPGIIYLPLEHSTRLRVPYVHQDTDYSCWFAATQMIFQFKHMSVAPLYSLYKADTGLPLGREADLLTATGMAAIPAQASSYSAPQIECFLRKYGPLLMPLKDPSLTRQPHMMVIAGVENGNIYLNDPGGRPAEHGHPAEYFKVRDMAWFNLYLDRASSLMYLP